MLKNIPMDTGVTDDTKKRFAKAIKLCESEKDKVHYDKATDKVVDFEDWWNVRTEKYADYSLVFMMQMVESGDRIPLLSKFCNGQTTTAQLLLCTD